MADKKRIAVRVCVDLAFYFVGSVIFAVGMQMFIAPNQIAPGGLSAVAIVLNYLTDLPIGMYSLLMNIPLLLFGLKFLGWIFTAKTLAAVVVMSVCTDAFAFLPPYRGDEMLAALFGGLLLGVGMALVFMRDSTTGGVDILSRLIQTKLPHISMGKLLMMIDAVIIFGSAAVFGKLETVLYSLIAVAVCSYAIDTMLCGLDRGKVVYIISQNSRKISKRIITELDRGCTLLQAKGAYSEEAQQVILVAVRMAQYHRLREIVHREDSRAFVVVTDSSEVLGEGFKPFGNSR